MGPRMRAPCIRLRLYDGAEKALQQLVKTRGENATTVINDLLLAAVSGEEKDYGTYRQD